MEAVEQKKSDMEDKKESQHPRAIARRNSIKVRLLGYDPLKDLYEQETALYRHFDKDGALLYVGISGNPFKRSGEHRQKREWFKSVVTITLEWFDDRYEAEDAEIEAIKAENPVYNVEHNE